MLLVVDYQHDPKGKRDLDHRAGKYGLAFYKGKQRILGHDQGCEQRQQDSGPDSPYQEPVGIHPVGRL